MNRDQIKGIVWVALGAASYGILATFVKLAYDEHFTTSEVTFSQYFLGFAGIGLLNLFARKTTRTPVRPAQAGKLMLAGTSMGFTGTFYYYSVQYVPVSLAIVLLMQTVWMGVVAEMILEKHAPSWLKTGGALLVCVGSILATDAVHNLQTLDWRGIGWGLLAALSYTVFVVASNRIAPDLPSLRRSFWLMTGALLLVACVALPDLLEKFDVRVIWKYGLVLSLFGTILPPLLFTAGMPLTGLGLGTIITALEIPVSVSMAYFILDETVVGTQWLGIVVILSAIVVMNWRSVAMKRA